MLFARICACMCIPGAAASRSQLYLHIRRDYIKTLPKHGQQPVPPSHRLPFTSSVTQQIPTPSPDHFNLSVPPHPTSFFSLSFRLLSSLMSYISRMPAFLPAVLYQISLKVHSNESSCGFSGWCLTRIFLMQGVLRTAWNHQPH